MADQRLVEALLSDVGQWNSFRLVAANLAGANLARADLAEADLAEADLSGANLREAGLCEANLRRANLARADVVGADLSGADLREASLHKASLLGASLRAADLRGADLSGAYLVRADLRGANLREACLREAELNEANLREANLNKADLREAALAEANFNRSQLSGANLERAMVGPTVFGDVDLCDVLGLDSVWHAQPSTIGVDTLYRSQGRIPEVFLRGCGVPHVMVDYIPSLTVSDVLDFYSSFISYSHANATFARRLHDSLFHGSRISCWLDEHQLLPGDKLDEQIDAAIRATDKVLLVCSKEVLDGPSGGWWVDREVTRALQREERLSRERNESVNMLIPLDLDGFLFSPECTYHRAADLRERVVQTFVGWESDDAVYRRGLDRVVRALRTDGFQGADDAAAEAVADRFRGG